MTDRIYFSVSNGSMVDNYEIARAAMLVDGKYIRHDDFKTIRDYAASCDGIIKELNRPSINYLVEHGYKVQAVKLYYDRHSGMTLKECKEVIDKIEADLKGY